MNAFNVLEVRTFWISWSKSWHFQLNSTHFFYIHTYIFLFNSNKHVLFLVCSLRVQSLCSAFQNYCCFAISGADPGFFLGGGTLVSCPTSTPINHIYIFFWQNTSCIRKPQVISRGGGEVRTPCTLPLDPPLNMLSRSYC